MKKSEIIDLLQSSIKGRNRVRIFRKGNKNEPIDCIPLIRGQRLLLLQCVFDFLLDGYKIIRLKDISSVRSSKSEKFHDFILRQEGISSNICVPSKIPLESWRDVLRVLNDSGKIATIECEYTQDYRFNIGKIVDFSRTSVSMMCFDVIGLWDDVVTDITYKDISSVSFDDRYSQTMSKYTREAKTGNV